jgi:hypothetical protein
MGGEEWKGKKKNQNVKTQLTSSVLLCYIFSLNTQAAGSAFQARTGQNLFGPARILQAGDRMDERESVHPE